MSKGPESDANAKTFLNISSAARLDGYSVRHFRRIIEDNEIPVMEIGRKLFISSKDFEQWQASQSQDGDRSCLRS